MAIQHSRELQDGADHPRDIPLVSWCAIVQRVWHVQSEAGLWVAAAGVAFYALLAMLPGLGFIVLTVGMTVGAQGIKRHLDQLKGVLPEEALTAFVNQLTAMLSATGGTLGWGAAGSLALMLWSGMLGMRALIVALNLTYREFERRGLLALNALALVLGLSSLVFVALTFALFIATPTLIAALPFQPGVVKLWELARWPVLAAVILLALALLYRVGPSRAAPKWRWVSWGALVAAATWIIASVAFSTYVQHVANYQSAYGLAGAVMILMLWLNLSAYAVLLGAALNAEMERQTSRDTAANSG